MERDKPRPFIGLVILFVGGLATLLGLLIVYPLVTQVPRSVLHQLSNRTGLLLGLSFGVTLGAATGAEYFTRRNAARQTEERKRTIEQLTTSWADDLRSSWKPNSLYQSESVQSLLRQQLQDIRLWASTSPPSEGAIIDLRRQLDEIKDRVEKQRNEIVEVHKIDPVLEATLKGSIENLVKRIEILEKKQLEKWDVALVCAQVIGGIMFIIAAVSGVVFVVVKYFLGK